MTAFLKYHSSKPIITHPILLVPVECSMQIFQRNIIIFIKPLHNKWFKKPGR